MILTGKCKVDFEEWYLGKFIYLKHNIGKNLPSPNRFCRTVNSMQYGVYVDFFDSVGMSVGVNKYFNPESEVDFIWYAIKGNTLKRDFAKTRPVAREQSIERANKIYNDA